MPPRRYPALTLPVVIALGLGAVTLGPAADPGSGPAGRVGAPAAVTSDDLPAGSVVADERIEQLVRSGDRIYAHGWFSTVGRYAGPGTALDTATGVDAASPRIADGQVSVALADGSGGWYLGGDFTRIGGRAAGGLAHVRADGSLDSGFLPVADGLVSALALDGDTLYAGGIFESIDGVSRHHLAALATDDGAVSDFDAPQAKRVTELVLAPAAGDRSARLFVAAENVSAVDPASGDPVAGFAAAVDEPVRAMTLGADRLYVGGAGLAALDASTGAVDRGFATDLGGPAGPPFDRRVHALLYTGDRLYVGGDLAAGRLVALDPASGAVDPAFAPAIRAERNAVGVPAGVYDLALEGDRLWAAGSFTTVAGQPAGGLAVLDATTGAPTGPAVPSYDLQANTVELSGGHGYVGGHFYLSDFVRTEGIAALDADTLEPMPGFAVPDRAYGDLLVGRTALFVAPTHFLGYDPSPAAAQSHQFYSQWDWWIRAFDRDTGAELPGRSLQVSDLTGVTTIGNRLYVARRMQDDVRFPRNQIEVYGASGKRVAIYPLPLRGYVTELDSIDGDLVAAGSFKRRTRAGGPRNTAILRLDRRTGERRPAFDPRIEGPVYDVAPAGRSLFAAGLFTRVLQGPDLASPGLTRLDARSRRDPSFAPGPFAGDRVLLRVSPLGRLLWVDGGSTPFLDAATGAVAPDPTDGWADRVQSITGTDGALAFTSWIEPNLGGRDPYRLGFVAPVR